jgi:hypothetical protein
VTSEVAAWPLTPALSQRERGRRRGIPPLADVPDRQSGDGPPLADVPDRQSGDGPPQRVIRREDSVIPMPVLARLRDEIGEPIEELKRRQLDNAAGPWPR